MNTADVPAPRRAYLDNLKVWLVTGVIVGHVLITYADIGSWAYREPSNNKAFLLPAALFVALGSLFAIGRAAFGAYVLQAPVAVTIARLAGPLPIAPELKFVVVAPAAVAGSFGLAWLLARVPGLKRIL